MDHGPGERKPMTEGKKIALVLAGGVAKGAFEAGALRLLVRSGITFTRIVASSSGALSGALVAAAARFGREQEGAERLVALWESEASWRNIIDPTGHGILSGRGFSTSAKLRALLSREMSAIAVGEERRPIDLHVVVTALAGAEGRIGRERATTFERVLGFRGDQFDSEEAREPVALAAAASAAFPGLYEPVELPGIGPCVDGGAVNNAPIGIAVEGGAERVVVISPFPLSEPPSAPEGFTALISRLTDALLRERLYRDLKRAEQVNQALRGLDELERMGTLGAAQVQAVHKMLGLGRTVEVVLVCPETDLPGGAFSAFANRRAREEYIAAGALAAARVLERISW